MKFLYRLLIFGGVMLVSIPSTQAQIFKKLKDKIAGEAEKAVDRQLNKNSKNKGIAEEDCSTNSNRIQIEENGMFIPGDSLVYATNFDRMANGSMPDQWKTTGSGSVVKISRFSGKWLNMSERTSYKLKRTIDYPDRFTVEFDLIIAADKVNDLSSLFFGFTKDNSLSRWISNSSIWHAQLQYMNSKDFVVSSKVRDLYRNGSFDLGVYANQKMHVSIAVDGDRVKIYLDDTKIADSDLFRGQRFKHFFISSPLRSDNGASALFGNFKINTYSEDF
ncbi:hypothetical protein [Mesonia aestuariivivens]|uniref:LamG domain-containing protein n=1 Tax=Mesonia aestuariivivens TaxID=2796128 RepID=A0ABS6VZW6_9FLAO|nr:hypothetical protein [Mesonia aestuariivivens]MBW2961141.1 hypothetical protein [Mesonia aestuariivivens]